MRLPDRSGVSAVSLLLDALKKAELAKQSASGVQGVPTVPPADTGSGLSLESVPGAPAERTLITRDRLPDITQPLEILSEDLPSAGARREAPSPAAAPTVPRATSAATAATAPADDERASARQLFEAKTPDYDPRRPFFIVVGLLGVAIVGTLGYFAWEYFGPQPSFYTPRAAATAPQSVAAPVTPPQVPAKSAAATPPSDPVPGASAAPGASAQTAPAAGAAAVPAGPQSTPSVTTRAIRPEPSRPAASRPAPAATAEGAAGPSTEPRTAAAAPRSPVQITAGGPRVDPVIESAWGALQAGDLARARDEYQRALRANPRDRDALLGLATIDARTQQFETAEARYLRVLELDPRDPYAQAGLFSLRGQTDPVQSESRIKNMLAQQPDAAFLNFPLGNQYAAQGRWPDAQAAYFRAFSADPDNPDYAYNLAVSLDHLGQGKLALEYYRRALALAGNRAVGFNSAPVEARIRELTR
jgi:Tfp pilus assembly protein PilF